MFSEIVYLLKGLIKSSNNQVMGRPTIIGLLLPAIIMLLLACGGTDVATPTRNGGTESLGESLTPEEEDDFRNLIDSSGLISPEFVDFDSANGLLYEAGLTDQQGGYLSPDTLAQGDDLGDIAQQIEQYGLLGAVTVEPISHGESGGNVIGVLYVDDSVAEGAFLPGTHIVILHDPIEESPPEEPDIELWSVSGNPFQPDGRELIAPEDIGLGNDNNVFQFTVGSHRCHICAPWLNGCLCFNCPHW